jgi:hypothetical protein
MSFTFDASALENVNSHLLWESYSRSIMKESWGKSIKTLEKSRFYPYIVSGLLTIPPLAGLKRIGKKW